MQKWNRELTTLEDLVIVSREPMTFLRWWLCLKNGKTMLPLTGPKWCPTHPQQNVRLIHSPSYRNRTDLLMGGNLLTTAVSNSHQTGQVVNSLSKKHGFQMTASSNKLENAGVVLKCTERPLARMQRWHASAFLSKQTSHSHWMLFMPWTFQDLQNGNCKISSVFRLTSQHVCAHLERIVHY